MRKIKNVINCTRHYSTSVKQKKEMPKQVGLEIYMKSAIRSKKFIKYLNNLGRCISYDIVLRIDTLWAMGIMNEGEGYCTVPSNIQRNIFTQAAFDNGDYGQENASHHVTNIVLYQYTQGSFQNVNRITPMSRKIRRRSINILSERKEELRVTQKPDLPDFYSDKSISFNAKLSSDFITSQYTTATWILSRHMSTKLFPVSRKQIVPVGQILENKFL